MPKTIETRYRGGSVQARQVIRRLHKQPHPYIFFSNHTLMLPVISKLNSQKNFVSIKVLKTFSKNVEGCRDGSAKNHMN